MRRTIGALASSLALAAVLSGCGGDPEPQFEEEPSAAPATTSPSASAEPEPWEEKSDEGAIAFVEHWIDEFNKMRASGNTEAIDAISTSSCESCVGSIALTRELYSAGGQIDTEGWRILSISEPAEKGSEEPLIGLRVLQAPQLLTRDAEAKPERFEGGRADLTAFLVWRQGRWQMDRLDLA
jgi:hypothetical protein